MRRRIAIIFLSTASLALACGDDITEGGIDKVDADEQEMTLDPDGDGVAEGEAEGSLGSMTFELSSPLPEISGSTRDDDVGFRSFDATFDAAMGDIADNLDITVSSPRTGVAVSLTADGTLVPAPPSGPGEWSVTLDDSRTEFSIEWYNEVSGGARIAPGQRYDVVYSLGANCCMERIDDTAIEFYLGG